MNTKTLSNVLELPVEERIKLVEEIWDSIAEFPEAVPLTEEQKNELDRRLELYRNNPNELMDWDRVKEVIASYK
jgi:putative addiction module component (TIGR02574 family)